MTPLLVTDLLSDVFCTVPGTTLIFHKCSPRLSIYVAKISESLWVWVSLLAFSYYLPRLSLTFLFWRPVTNCFAVISLLLKISSDICQPNLVRYVIFYSSFLKSSNVLYTTKLWPFIVVTIITKIIPVKWTKFTVNLTVYSITNYLRYWTVCEN